MSILNTGSLVKQARSEGRAESKAELTRLRREVRRLRGWLRHIARRCEWATRLGACGGEGVRLATVDALRGKQPPREKHPPRRGRWLRATEPKVKP